MLLQTGFRKTSVPRSCAENVTTRVAWVFSVRMKMLVELLTLAVHVSKSASQDWLVIDPPGISETGGSVLKLA